MAATGTYIIIIAVDVPYNFHSHVTIQYDGSVFDSPHDTIHTGTQHFVLTTELTAVYVW